MRGVHRDDYISLTVSITYKLLSRVVLQKSDWGKSFQFYSVRILIVCRGPVRLEAIQAFRDMGASCGILLSEKDSVSYTHTRAPELRIMPPEAVHSIFDYTGATQIERKKRIQEIIQIAKKHNYNYVFAGYGFMAEDADFVAAIEEAGIAFIGPASQVHRLAGSKDTAKTIARSLKVSVTPGIDNISALTLLAKTGSIQESLSQIVKEHDLDLKIEKQKDLKNKKEIAEYAEIILQASYHKNVALLDLEEIRAQAQKEGTLLLKEHPKQRLRLKYIGGGGGKGQRIISKGEEIPNAVLEILSEAKVLGKADNKNFLMELNIENIRHNEIQLLGNGDWCVSLGGRDCSFQMHEQKQVELSITDELFAVEIEQAKQEAKEAQQKEEQTKIASIIAVLEKDRKLLAKMETQALDFAKAVHLDSASTFECIVTEDDFFFMEMNTRIQVEHRVSEMAYRLRFCNPKNKEDFFEVESLVQAMALIAVHGKKLPCPQRIARHVAGGEVRLNAQSEALEPAAGGIIEFWSPPLEKELRDDQGIGLCNPDSGEFIPYHLAGAYDSNIALILSWGKQRRENLENLAESLRCMELRGQDVQSNRNFLYGIINLCLGLDPMLKANTAFVLAYLRAVGALAIELEKIDWEHAYRLLQNDVEKKYGRAGLHILEQKQILFLRPLKILTKNPHACAGFLMRYARRAFGFADGTLLWKRNPLRMLADLYYYLHLEERKNANPAQQIWSHDQELLQRGLEFYAHLEQEYLGMDTEVDFRHSMQSRSISESKAYKDFENALYTISAYKVELSTEELEKCQAAHRAWQLALPLMNLLLYAGKASGILGIELDESLRPVLPQKFLLDLESEKERDQKESSWKKILSPPPARTADTLVAEAGGMFYAQESPELPPYLKVGTHFKQGDPLYIIEVMKMFNKVHAEFSGKVKAVLFEEEQGKVVKKGQPLFRVEPDEVIHIETEAEKKKRRCQLTEELWRESSSLS